MAASLDYQSVLSSRHNTVPGNSATRPLLFLLDCRTRIYLSSAWSRPRKSKRTRVGPRLVDRNILTLRIILLLGIVALIVTATATATVSAAVAVAKLVLRLTKKKISIMNKMEPPPPLFHTLRTSTSSKSLWLSPSRLWLTFIILAGLACILIMPIEKSGSNGPALT